MRLRRFYGTAPVRRIATHGFAAVAFGASGIAATPVLAAMPSVGTLSELGFETCGGRAAVRPHATSGARPSAPPSTPPRNAESEGESSTSAIERGGVVSKTTITSSAIAQSDSQNTFDAIKGVPGVANTDARPGSGADSLQIRGIKLNSVSSYRLEGGLPIVNSINLPLEDKCKVEALKGTGALQYGVATPAGIIDYVLKRPTYRPVASLGYSGNEYGQTIGSLDVGGRFGDRRQLGLRFNFAGGALGPPIRGANGTRYVAALTGDYDVSKRALLQVDEEQFGLDVIEQAALQLNKASAKTGRIVLPKVPDPHALLSGPWAVSEGWGHNDLVRFAYAMPGNVRFVAEVGRSEGNRPARNVAQLSAYDVVTGKGTESVTYVRNQDYVNSFESFQIVHRADGRTAENELTLGVDYNVRDFNNPQNPTVKLSQNIYDPVALTLPAAGDARSYFPNNSSDFDEYVTDNLSLFDRLHVLGGLRLINYAASNQVSNTRFDLTKKTTLAPGAGLTFDLRPNLTLYASYVQSLEISDSAPVNAANAFQVLPPGISNQKEVGIRGSGLGAVSPTLGYFRISRANATTDPTTNIYGLNGTITYEGLESTVNVRATRSLALDSGAILMRAMQHADDPTIDGKQSENTPYLSYDLGFSYLTPFVRGLTLTGGGQFVGARELNPQNQGTLPAVGLGRAGINYAGRMGAHRFSLSANVSNITDLRYFSNVVRGTLGVGAPRTITFGWRLQEL